MQDTTIFKTKSFEVIKRKEPDDQEWHYVRRRAGIAILAITQTNEMVLVKQTRPIIAEDLIEIPAGGIENEHASLVDEARRELREETGFDARKIEKLLTIYPSPGYYTEKTHIFLATNLHKGAQHLTDLEQKNQLRVIKVPVTHVIEDILKGKIRDAKTIVAILFYAQKKLLPKKQQEAAT